MLKFAIVLAFVAAAVNVLITTNEEPQSFAFDSTFPEDGSEWKFEVVLDETSTALAEKEAELLDKLDMSPIFRCRKGLFGVRWMGRSFFKNIPQEPLLRLYKLVLEDANPPDENTFIVRHQILGWKTPMTSRYDKFTCAEPSTNGSSKVCKKWNSEGFVAPRFTKRLTKGATEDPIYYQTLTMVPGTKGKAKICPLVKAHFWCLGGILCPSNREYTEY